MFSNPIWTLQMLLYRRIITPMSHGSIPIGAPPSPYLPNQGSLDPFMLTTHLLADDDSNNIIIESEESSIRTKTTWTLLLYLTSQAEGCQGGETVFFPFDRRVAKEEVAIAPETGMLLLHKHGRDCMLVSTHQRFFFAPSTTRKPRSGTCPPFLGEARTSLEPC